ncbi:MAG: M48 family metallopeptidase [Chlamydiales bacterium]|nr:M48 family metallopeptidase [Chlamydiales bacterium]
MLNILAAACANVVVPEATEEAMRYYNSGNLLWILNQAWSLIVPLLFLVTGFTGKLASFSEKWGKRWFFAIALYLVIFTCLFTLLNLPLDFYAGFIREHAYGLSNQTIGRWFSNYGKSLIVTIVGSIAFVWVFYLLLKKSPRRWWLYGSLVSIAIAFITMFIQPIWIDPLFNNFGPMKDKKLEQQILSLAARAGIEGGRVYEVDKSQDTNALNAYVVGFGRTNRIVLWDTTIAKMTPDQILFVMGHEMGHYVLHHIWWLLVYFSALSFLIFYLTYRAANFLMHRYQKRFGFKHLYSIASLPLLLLLTSLFMFLTSPLDNAISRCMEHEADRFGLEITQNNQAAGEAFLALQHQNLANPRPGALYRFWRCSHPPLSERVDFCNSYCPWKSGQPLEYGKYFKAE